MGEMACHWDLNELLVIEQQLQWLEPSMEMLSLESITDINQIYSAFDVEIDGGDSTDSQEMQDLFEMAQEPCRDAFAFISNLYFSFDKRAYMRMIALVQKREGMAIDSLKVMDKRGFFGLRKWERIQASLSTVTNEDGAKYLAPIAMKRGFYTLKIERGLFSCHTSEHLDWTTAKAAIASI
ncbi:hypothetical protein GOP47_0002464 [Adiantum capillus-veneris]|uniref:Uncharacterized protein n=1 Tax=Adiantum capillus-veneris TaxID=13818 RepID=A0A9D4ZQZ7_ADICA|nr:hypothetical protein GOP47_0002464 [Adiantum capillus-veneris]